MSEKLESDVKDLLALLSYATEPEWDGHKECILRGREKTDLYDVLEKLRDDVGWHTIDCLWCSSETLSNGCYHCRGTGKLSVPGSFPQRENVENYKEMQQLRQSLKQRQEGAIEGGGENDE